MKCTAIFLVLSLVVLMAQPAEGFLGLIVQGLHAIHGLISGKGKDVQQQAEQQQQQLDKRAFEQLQYN
uniref:Uncharacterized protein n=1 Tax=Oryzias latipes TaxID=8090 RepID=A0A3B3I3A8_ORYLA